MMRARYCAVTPCPPQRTARGEQNGSLGTPRGRHIVRAKIGAGQAPGAVFSSRRPPGEVWTRELHEMVYIHGAPDFATMGQPGSHGCVRMRNADVAELFDLVPCYARVDIVA